MTTVLDEFKARIVDNEIEGLFLEYLKNAEVPDIHYTRLTFYMTLAAVADAELVNATDEYDKLFTARIHHAYAMTLAKLVYAIYWPKK